MSHNILNDISAVYVAEVLGPKIKAGGDGEGKKVEKGGTSEEASAKRVRQAVYDIRYRARREGIELAQAFSQYTGKSSMTGQEKTAVKEKLGLAEEVEAIQEEGQKYQVRVRDKESGKTYVRYATREKIAQLRANPNISSVEMTKYGKPYEGEKERGEYTSKVKAGKGLDPVGREDKDIDNDGDHDKTDKYLLNRRKVRGNAIATRKEEHEVPDKNLKSLVSKASKRLDADVDGDVDKNDPKSGPMGAFVPSPDGKKRVYAGKVKSEGFYSWRDSLNEIADEMDDKKRKIKEKKIENKIKINPTLGESIENLGGKLLDSEEFVGIFEEVEDVDLYHIDEELIENVLIEFYEEILEEGYDLLEVRKEIIETLNIEMALLDEATVTYGHDTDTKGLKRSKMDSMKSAVKKAYKKGKEAYDSPSGKRVRKKVKRGLYRIAKRVSNVADRAAQRLMDVGEAVTQMPGRETTPPSGTTAKQDDVQVKQKDEALRKQMLAKKKQMMMKQQMLDRQRLQAQQQGKLPMGQHEEVEHLSEDEYRRMLAKERQAERESEKEFRTKGKVGEKKSGPKLSSTKRSAVAGKDYADSQMGSIKIHDKASKGKHTIGSPFSEEVEDIEEKALSKAQQRFMGMVYATKKGDMPAPSAAVAKAAASMTGKEAKDFAKTKHKGLPEKKVAKEEIEIEEGLDKRFDSMRKRGGRSAPEGERSIGGEANRRNKDYWADEGGKNRDRGAGNKAKRRADALKKEEIELIDERRKEDKVAGTPRNDIGKADLAYRAVKKTIRDMSGGRPAGQRKKEPGKKPPTAGQYGGPKSPAQKVAMRRAAAQRSQDNMSSRYD